MNIWKCKIGWGENLPFGADSPMREAVRRAFKDITGKDPDFIFSGWGASLTEPELAVVENREPSEEYRQEWMQQNSPAGRAA